MSRIRRRPLSTATSKFLGSRPANSSNWLRSILVSKDTFATETSAKPAIPAGIKTFPGAFAHFVFEVSGTTITVAIRVTFIRFSCTTKASLRNPGPDPTGSPKSAHQIWQRLISIRSLHCGDLRGVPHRVCRLINLFQRSIHLLRDLPPSFLSQIGGQRCRVKLTTRHFVRGRLPFRFMEQDIRDRNRSLHTNSVLKVIPIVDPSSSGPERSIPANSERVERRHRRPQTTPTP